MTKRRKPSKAKPSARTRKSPPRKSGGRRVAATKKTTPSARIKALRSLGTKIFRPKEFARVVKVLQDSAEAEAVRLAALQVLQAASFSAVRFAQLRPDYLVALRSVAADPSHELRQRVLGLLAREQDGFAVQTLLNGLTDPSKALLPPEKALQLLGNDPHAEVYDVARRIADSPPNPTARREALRVLGSDAASAPLFESLLADRAEDSDVRQLSSAVLNAVAPDRLQATARRVVLDPNEDAAVKAACLTALTQFGKPEQVLQDKDLLDRVSEIGSQSKGAMRRQAQQFLNKYRR